VGQALQAVRQLPFFWCRSSDTAEPVRPAAHPSRVMRGIRSCRAVALTLPALASSPASASAFSSSEYRRLRVILSPP
jgi:hypothetical protein